MRDRLLNAPAWGLGLLNGALFGLFWTAFTRWSDGDSWTSALVQGAVMGLVFGVVMGPLQHRQQRGVRDVAARSPEGLSRRVRRAALRGPVPAEPAVRQAASGLIGAQLVHLDRQRRWAPAFFVLMGVLSAFLAITGSPWWWAAVPAWALAAAGHLWMRAHLRRRAALLSEVS